MGISTRLTLVVPGQLPGPVRVRRPPQIDRRERVELGTICRANLMAECQSCAGWFPASPDSTRLAAGLVVSRGPALGVESIAVEHSASLAGAENGGTMNARAIKWRERLNTPMLIAAALTLPTVAITESKPGGTLEDVAIVLNWITWIAFLVELVVMLSVVPNRWAWVRRHPLDVIIVFLTPPVLPAGLQSLRVLRLLRLLRLFRLAQLSREVFSLEGLRYSLLLTVLTIVGGGSIFVAVEKEQHLSVWDGIYWAATTMTTLGSDIYPETTGGEIVT